MLGAFFRRELLELSMAVSIVNVFLGRWKQCCRDSGSDLRFRKPARLFGSIRGPIPPGELEHYCQ